MSSDVLHVTFSPLAAANLRRALKRLGRQEPVIGFSDDLSFGPINPPDPDLRAQWVKVELQHVGWRAAFRDRAAWTAISRHPGSLVAWMSRRSTLEYAGFLELERRAGSSPIALVDLPEPLQMHDEADLLNRVRPVTPEMRESYRLVWQRLRAENAAFRVLDPELNLISAPITFFDQQLLSFAREGYWLKAARIIGEMLTAFDEDGRHQTVDLPLIARLPALVELGLLESHGDLSQIRYSEVRLPTPAAPDSPAPPSA